LHNTTDRLRGALAIMLGLATTTVARGDGGSGASSDASGISGAVARSSATLSAGLLHPDNMTGVE
jgi:hypothetical protein